MIKNDMAPKFSVRDPRVIKHVLELYQQGHTCADISVAVGRKMSTCYGIIREFVQVGAIEGRGSGRNHLEGHEEAVDLVIKMTEIGATIIEIAQATDRSHGWVVQARMRLRSEGLMPAAKYSRRKIDWQEKLPDVYRMLEAGHALETISFSIEVNVETLRRKLRELGVQTPRQKALARYRDSRRI
jgi:transposase